ncbi:hypothetical protein N7523_004730 [Penicillium sp. IBT 18751x]|nr:hypothetical protein N7523_004730 [Penicillium sp. IBT 18751x]
MPKNNIFQTSRHEPEITLDAANDRLGELGMPSPEERETRILPQAEKKRGNAKRVSLRNLSSLMRQLGYFATLPGRIAYRVDSRVDDRL